MQELALNELADKLDRATHIAWATGGNMVPEQERSDYYATGKALLSALKA